MEMILSLETRASLRSLLRYGLEEVTTLSFLGRVSFRLKGSLREYASVPYRKGFLFDTDVPWRFREAYRRHSQDKLKSRLSQTIPGIRCMTWNASKNLVYDELLYWYTS